MTDEDVQTILAGLERLRSIPVDPDDLCARAHQWKINPPLTKSQVRQFEAEHRIRLPDDYRTFLIRIGNGGVGPAYGVFKLGERDGAWENVRWTENDGYVGTLSKPFPHTEAWNELPIDPPFDRLHRAEWERQVNELEARYFDGAHMNGALPICNYGCNELLWLVVNGAEAGNLWWDHRTDRIGIYPFMSGTARVSFLRWYREWLDEELAKLDGQRVPPKCL